MLEKHGDFLRDFRGDTIHPTTLDLLDQLGLTNVIRDIPHSEVTTLDAVINGVRFTSTDFTHVGDAGALWFMPQWDLLNAIADAGREHSSFHLLMSTAATAITREGGRVTGVTATGPDGDLTIKADLTVAADGRHSTVRDSARLHLNDSGVPIDVLWFRVDEPEKTPPDAIIYVAQATVITIPRTGYYQCGLLIHKDTFDDVKAEGLDAFRRRVTDTVPFLKPTIGSVETWEDVQALNVRIAHAPRWHRPGLLLIGDAAHPMSPAFGVGINYAVQDAVAAARVIIEVGDPGLLTDTDLHRIQRRRAMPALVMQQIQRGIHRTIGRPQDQRRLPSKPLLRVVTTILGPVLRRLTGWLVGTGLRPERIDFP